MDDKRSIGEDRRGTEDKRNMDDRRRVDDRRGMDDKKEWRRPEAAPQKVADKGYYIC